MRRQSLICCHGPAGQPPRLHCNVVCLISSASEPSADTCPWDQLTLGPPLHSSQAPFSLQAFAQVPNLTVWYGPDTYMGRNLAQLFRSLADQPDEEVARLHSGHTQASIRALLPRLHYFEEGTCIVHHVFGGEVTELVRKG